MDYQPIGQSTSIHINPRSQTVLFFEVLWKPMDNNNFRIFSRSVALALQRKAEMQKEPAESGEGLRIYPGSMANAGKTTISHPFGNGLYHLFIEIWGMV